METLIIDRTTMMIGGVEVYFASLMEYALSTKRRVIWLTTRSQVEKAGFSITASDKIEKAFVKRTFFGPIYPRINVSEDEEVILITTDPCRYILSDVYRDRLKCKSFVHLLILPHFKGPGYYPENIFKNLKVKGYWHKKMSLLASTLVGSDCVRGFSVEHLIAYEKAYDVIIKDKEKKALPRVNKILPIRYDEISSREHSRCQRFEIMTCSRFDFPHKGYLLGLIKEFAKIHEKHPTTKLTIVGYGGGKPEIEKAIENLPKAAIDSIDLVGELSPEELISKYRQAHLNVGLAGALKKGAECGLPSIKMKHYTYSCDGFGFIEDTQGLNPDCAAKNMREIIESVITMPADEYIQHSLAAYDAAVGDLYPDPDYIFRQNSVSSSLILPVTMLQARILFGARLFLHMVLGRSLFE